MYLEEIRIENYGCITDLIYKAPFNEDRTPKPIVFIGKNGSGKTLLLSNIINCLIGFKQESYNEIQEVDQNKYYRVSSFMYIKSGAIFSHIDYKFTNESYFSSFMTNNFSVFKNNVFTPEKYSNLNIEDTQLTTKGFFNKIYVTDKNIFDQRIYLYFPVDRYYIPTWLNSDNTKLKFSTDLKNNVGRNNVNIIKNNMLQDIEKWILDVIIDKLLYEEIKETYIIKEENRTVQIVKQINGKNTKIHNNLNKIIFDIVKLNDKECISARLGISTKSQRHISILKGYKDGSETEYVPSFSNLSSGEVMILSIFASIMKEYDRVTSFVSTEFSDIKGIVIIDEIDSHLHSDLAKIILPNLIKMFSGIQFIMSSHSPFFLLGMQETFENGSEFVNLPDGTLNNLENFDEIQKMYAIIYEGYEKTIEELNKYKMDIETHSKPIIITEGKTDWKHLKNALTVFKSKNEFLDLDIEFLEFEDGMGDSCLERLLKELAKITHAKKIIGLFDNDEKIGQKYDQETPVHFENNVYAWCIPNPRNLPYGISIELLYEDSDIKITDGNGRRLFLSDEFMIPSMRLIGDTGINTTNKKVIECNKTKIVKIIDAEVYDNNGTNIALTKDAFIENISKKTTPFNGVDIKNFRDVFKRIQQIIDIS